MNELTIFNFDEYKIRTLLIKGEPFFVGKDITEVLDYKESNKAVARHVDEDDRMKHPITDNLGRNQDAYIINESGLYSLILSSKLPTAKRFKHWVTKEVLPSIRKTGMYATEELLNNPDLAIDAFTRLKEEMAKRKALEAKNEEMRPKALFADAVSASHTSILIGELAKILKQNGVPEMGQNRLFDWMRSHGYLISRRGTDYNMPTQRSMELGLFEIKETAISHADGHQSISKTPKVTGKGQQYFINRFLKEESKK